jgi:hypothetical protein
MPWVTATAALLRLRPVAKMFGCRLGDMYNRGMGMPARSARPFDDLVRPGGTGRVEVSPPKDVARDPAAQAAAC